MTASSLRMLGDDRQGKYNSVLVRRQIRVRAAGARRSIIARRRDVMVDFINDVVKVGKICPGAGGLGGGGS